MTEPSLQDKCAALVTEMGVVRDFTLTAEDWEDPSEVHRRLREDLRPRLDHAEELLREMAGYRRQARNAAARAAAEYAAAYDAALHRLSRAAMSREYESIRDREVQARVLTAVQNKDRLRAEATAQLVDDAYEAVRGMFFGLRDIREELLRSLQFLPWEASLERT